MSPFLVAMLVVACSLPVPAGRPAHTFLLGLDEPLPPVRAGNPGSDPGREAVLFVGEPEAQPGFDTPMMAYLRRPHEVSYYAKSEWADTPANMLAPVLVRALEQSGTWSAVVEAPGGVRADYRLDTSQLALGHEFFGTPSRVRMTLRAQLVELAGRRVVGTRTFEVVEEAPTDDARGGAIAANRAARRLLADLTEWLGARLRR